MHTFARTKGQAKGQAKSRTGTHMADSNMSTDEGLVHSGDHALAHQSDADESRDGDVKYIATNSGDDSCDNNLRSHPQMLAQLDLNDLAGHGQTMPGRFTSLWQRCTNADDSAAEELYAEVEQRYAESQRHYHVFGHIAHCVRQFDAYLGQATNAELAQLVAKSSNGSQRLRQSVVDAIELAIWFHDVIYSPCAKDNEHESALWFEAQAKSDMDKPLIDNVIRLIMATVHKDVPERGDECVLVDVDLSSFGSDWEAFERDSQAVRDEACHLSDSEYVANQCRFLQRLIERETIYCTDYFRQQFEANARRNISAYLKFLQTEYLGASR